MPKTYGVKDKDVAVAHIIDKVLAGELRSGQRVDRNEVAAALGISRVPVQEAIAQLEHDGVISTRYHRGAFVETLDADVVAEHHEVFGELSGIASARAATHPTPRLLKDLGALVRHMRGDIDAGEFEDDMWTFRRTVNDEYAGPRLRAALSASQSFIPKAFWVSGANQRAVLLPTYAAELRAIRWQDPDGARRVCRERAAAMSEVTVRELLRRGVLTGEPTEARGPVEAGA